MIPGAPVVWFGGKDAQEKIFTHLTQGLTIYQNHKLLTAEDTESAEVAEILLSVTSAFSAVKIFFYGQDYRFA